MIAALLLATLAAQSPEPPPLEDYLPGGPERVQVDALEWLERSQSWLDAQDGAEVALQVTRDGVTTRDTHWFFRGRIAIAAAEFALPLESDEDLDFSVLLAGSETRESIWADPVYGGYPALIHWLDCENAPGFAALSLTLDPTQQRAARIDWIRDGLRGTLDLDADGAPLAWSWTGDGFWGRTSTAVVEVQSWTSRTREEAPTRLGPAIQESGALFFDAGSGCGTTSEPLTSRSAEEATQTLLQRFGTSRRIRFSGRLNLLLGTEAESAIDIGELSLIASLGWPSYGRLSIAGELGPADQRKEVRTDILGDGKRFWHWDRGSDELRPVPGLADLLAGMQGLLPLYAWAARGVPSSGWDASWIGESFVDGDEMHRWLRVVDGPTTSDFLVHHWTIREARVFATGAGQDAPILHYRFDALGPHLGDDLGVFAEDREAITTRIESQRAQALIADPRVAELLPVGERAPSAAAWTGADGSRESLESLRGKPAVLIFWYRDPTGSLPALKAVHDLRRKLDRVGEDSHFRAIAIDEEVQASATWLTEQNLSLPLGIGDASLQRAFRARWLPTTYLIGSDGVVLGHWLGTPGPALTSQLDRLLRRSGQTRD